MMLDRLLVPLDGSKSGEVALPFLQRLPLKVGTRIVLAQIVEPDAVDPGPGFIEESLEFAYGYLGQIASSLGGEGIVVETLVRCDRVAESLAAAAVEEGASLILLATHGRTASDARPFGGVTEQLIRTSSVPILAVPSLSFAAFQAAPGPPIQSILVTTDGSDYADAVVPLAADIAAACDCSILLLEVIPASGSEYRASSQEAAAEEHLKRLSRIFEKRGLSTERITGRGHPVGGILELARRRNVDLIAMSTHGGAQRTGTVVGSVTQAVLQQSGVPVLMTRTRPAPRRPNDRRKVARARRGRG
jgi:nucleotide-binding universal stress UspA family protein